MLPPLATTIQFDARLPGGLSSDDGARAEATLEDASALVRAEAGQTWVNDAGDLVDVPDIIVSVTLAVAKRAFVNPDMVRSEGIQDYQVSFGSSSPDVYLTKAERDLIRRAVGRAGLWTLSTTRTDTPGGDLPAVSPTGGVSTIQEELDPFAEGW